LFVGDYHLFVALKQNLGGYKFKDDGEVETVVSHRLMEQGTLWH
jgi:hypothetical protein